MRKILISCSIIIVLLVLASCSSESGSLTVISDDYDRLKQMPMSDFDKDEALSRELLDYPYRNYSCFVSSFNGTVKVSNYSPDLRCQVMQMNNGYFVGINLDSFDGWIGYYPYYGKYPESGEPVIVAHENFCGFIQIDKNSGYVMTLSYDSADDIGKLYSLCYADNAWSFGKAAEFYGRPQAALYIESDLSIYIVTSNGILTFSTENKSISVMKDSSLLEYININSIVKLNDSFYCGSDMGIYEYNFKTNEENWYSMDFKKYVRK